MAATKAGDSTFITPDEARARVAAGDLPVCTTLLVMEACGDADTPPRYRTTSIMYFADGAANALPSTPIPASAAHAVARIIERAERMQVLAELLGDKDDDEGIAGA